MGNYELQQARLDLDTIKENLHSFLLQSYKNSNVDPEKSTQHTMQYLEGIVERVIKRQSINVEFSNGATPSWYTEVFKRFAQWLEQEIKVCELMAEHLVNDNNFS